jgi:hypothetical protein
MNRAQKQIALICCGTVIVLTMLWMFVKFYNALPTTIYPAVQDGSLSKSAPAEKSNKNLFQR